MRKSMVEKDHSQLSIRKQCELLNVNRNRLEVKKNKEWEPSEKHLEMIELMKLAHAKDCTMGARQLKAILERNGYETTRWTVSQMMKYAKIKAVYCRPETTTICPEDKKYPYLLGDREITEVDEVWATDITYIPWHTGYVYLTAIIDWKTRAILSWRLSNTMDVSFCLEALGEARQTAGTAPQIVNTDQGSQFTGGDWIAAVQGMGAKRKLLRQKQWNSFIFSCLSKYQRGFKIGFMDTF